MEFTTLINERTSIRSYDADKKVSADQINEIIQAVSKAPSWKNSQTSRYYAIVSDEMRAKFAATCLPAFNQKSSAGAAYIVTTFVPGNSGFMCAGGEQTNECGDGWGYYDLGLHDMLLTLKAKELGLDTLIMGIRDGEKIHELLSVPAEEQVVAVIAVGYAAVAPKHNSRKPVEEILKIF